MKRVLASVLFVVAACGGKSAPPPACPAGPQMATETQIQAIEQKMCGCEGDGECIAKVFQSDPAMGLTFGQVAEIASAHSQCHEETEAGGPTSMPTSGGSTGLASCDVYLAEVDRFMTCDKVPQAARDATKQGTDAMKSSWSDVNIMPAEAKKAANDGCAQSTDALKQAMAAMGCAP